MKQFNKIIGALSVPAFMLAVSCSDNTTLNEPAGSQADGKNIVSLSINTQAAINSRASEFPHISDGSKADKLVYSVYEKTTGADGKETYKLVEDYINEETGGVNVINNASFPLTIQLVMDPTDEYTVVLWAQNSDCKAYDTSDLTKVKVDYSKVTNNYELGDAFCNIAVVKGNQTSTETVMLRRPFAQINVGDAGWDYEAVALLRPNPRTYAKSSVVMKGLAQYYNVLEARTLIDADLDASKGEKAIYPGEVSFAMSMMPAFINLSSYDSTFDWSKLSYLPYSSQFGPTDDEGNKLYDSEIEEFLKLKLDDGNTWADYIGYDTSKDVQTNFNDNDLIKTGHFKYLSMCYVLVPVSRDNGNVKGAVINELSFTAADSEGNNSKTLFTLYNVPAQQNWRTNIISDKMFMHADHFRLYIVPTYAGDFINDGGMNTGDSYDQWHNVEMEKDEDSWYVSNVKDGYGDVNEDFKGYGDQDGQYDDWDEEQDNLKSENAR